MKELTWVKSSGIEKIYYYKKKIKNKLVDFKLHRLKMDNIPKLGDFKYICESRILIRNGDHLLILPYL